MKCTAENDDWRAGHDWVLVANRSADITVDNDKGLLWACPCGEFKWTSYAEWERSREKSEAGVHLKNIIDKGPDLAFGLLGALDS